MAARRMVSCRTVIAVGVGQGRTSRASPTARAGWESPTAHAG